MKKLNRLDGRFVSAAIAVAAISVSANAAIVYSGALNWVVPTTGTGPVNTTGLSVNFETGAHAEYVVDGADIRLWGNNYTYINTESPDGGNHYMANRFLNTPSYNRISLGTEISATGTWSGASGTSPYLYLDTAGSNPATPYSMTWMGWWAPNAQSYLGIKFQDANLATHYGWVQIAIGADSNTRSIVDYAYNSTPDQFIFAGATPAPGAIALLGLVGLVRGRRRA